MSTVGCFFSPVGKPVLVAMALQFRALPYPRGLRRTVGMWAAAAIFLMPVAGQAQAPAASAGPSHGELADRQKEMDEILYHRPIASVVSERQVCATGIRGEMLAALDAAISGGAPLRLADLCLAALTRAARAGRLEAVQNRRAPAALALDAGFMAGFAAREAMPAELPTMAALKVIAERCFAQREANAGLCSAAGYALGLRSSHGETVTPG